MPLSLYRITFAFVFRFRVSWCYPCLQLICLSWQHVFYIYFSALYNIILQICLVLFKLSWLYYCSCIKGSDSLTLNPCRLEDCSPTALVHRTCGSEVVPTRHPTLANSLSVVSCMRYQLEINGILDYWFSIGNQTNS